MGSPEASPTTTQTPSDSLVNDDGTLNKSNTIGGNSEYRTASGKFSKGKLDTELKTVDQASVDRVQNIKPENTNSPRPSSATANPLPIKDPRGLFGSNRVAKEFREVARYNESAKMPNSYVSTSSDDIKDLDDFSMPAPDTSNESVARARKPEEQRMTSLGQRQERLDQYKKSQKDSANMRLARKQKPEEQRMVALGQRQEKLERYKKSQKAAEAMRKEGASDEAVKKETGLNKFGFKL